MVNVEALAEYILKNYTGKVVEVGVGFSFKLANILAKKLKVIVTDIIEPNKVYSYFRLRPNLTYVMDDIRKPNLSIYNGCSLIYSLRPPVEIQEYIMKIARKVKADCIIRPLRGEEPKFGKLINYNGEFFYLI